MCMWCCALYFLSITMASGLKLTYHLSSIFCLLLFFCQADITAPWPSTRMEAFPQLGKHNLTEPSALSRTHIPEASTVHQTKAVEHQDVSHSLRFSQYQTHWCCGRLAWSPRRGDGGLMCEAMPAATQTFPLGQGAGQDFGLPFCGQLIVFLLLCKEVNFTAKSSCTSWAAWCCICLLCMKNKGLGKSWGTEKEETV